MKYIFIIIMYIMFTGCQSYPQQLEYALEKAGSNRRELQKVLNYYRSQNYKKYQAACFLIENMPYHKSEIRIEFSPSHQYFFEMIDSLYYKLFKNLSPQEIIAFKSKAYDSLRREIALRYDSLPKPTSYSSDLNDIQVITADFLINNIENAFEIWETSPFCQGMDFNTFKESILPYRTSTESIQLKRSEIRDIYSKLFSTPLTPQIILAIEQYKAYIAKSRWLNYFINNKTHTGIFDLQLPRFKMDCYQLTNYTCNIFRSCGIPVYHEYTPLWRERDRGHFWCVSPDSSGILQPYSAPDNNLREDWESDIQYAGKIYRRTFGVNPNTPYFLRTSTEYIPENLNTPFLLDQTFRYHQTITIRLPFTECTPNQFAYLCFFKRGEYTPVAWGKIDTLKKEAIFEYVPTNTLFFPVYYQDQTPLPFSPPFIIKGQSNKLPSPLTDNKPYQICDFRPQNRVHTIKLVQDTSLTYIPIVCTPNNTINLTILRKYPEKRKLKKMYEQLKGAVLLGSVEEKKHFDTLCHLTASPHPYLQEINLKNKKKFRYYRFATNDKGPVNIAHMEFLGPYTKDNRCSSPTPLPIFKGKTKTQSSLYKIEGKPISTGSNPSTAFDGNMETFAGSSSIGVDFSQPVQITHIRFAPRNANNIIIPGDEYCLWYYDNGWEEFSTQTAEYNYLEFKNVPANTLYWLQNLNHGTEEMPFFSDGNQQIFIYDY